MEKVVVLSYLNFIHNKYEEWRVKKENISVLISVLIVDCNQDFENDPEVSAKIKEQIFQFMKLSPLK